jgi:Putative Ig domain
MTSAIRGSRLVTVVCAVVLAAGCKGGGDDSASASSPATASPTASASNAAPTISGTAATTLKPNIAYAFTPSASDQNGDTLSFQIQNKPGWATFNTVTGQLSGTPGIAQIGAYADIIISVSDGKQSVSLAAFTIMVAAAATSSGVTLAWIAPTENVDGTALTDLAGYMIAYGTSRAVLSKTVRIDNPSIDRYVFDDLAPGTYYFGIKAYSANDVESAMSAIVSKVVD